MNLLKFWSCLLPCHYCQKQLRGVAVASSVTGLRIKITAQWLKGESLREKQPGSAWHKGQRPPRRAKDLIDWAALGVKADLPGLGSWTSLLCVTYPADRLRAGWQPCLSSFQKGEKHKFWMFASWSRISVEQWWERQSTLFSCMCDQLVIWPVSGCCCSDTRNV